MCSLVSRCVARSARMEFLIENRHPRRRRSRYGVCSSSRSSRSPRDLDRATCQSYRPQQHTVVDERAQDVASIFRRAGFRVDRVRDMDAWLKRHAVFITAVAGALYESDCDARLLAQDVEAVRRLIVGVREGWDAQDREGMAFAPLALRRMMCWVPLRLSAIYWSRLLASPRGDLYFARHVRHAPAEMASLADDVRSSLPENKAPELRRLLASIRIGRFFLGI
jgi:hypothetical protein